MNTTKKTIIIDGYPPHAKFDRKICYRFTDDMQDRYENLERVRDYRNEHGVLPDEVLAIVNKKIFR